MSAPLLLGGLLLALALTGCGGSGASDMIDTARLEETQNNPEHATEIYQEVLRKYPGTPEAAIAQERLQALAEAAGGS
ncbi:MAG: hypothetical protein KIT14_07510 [bacterium]|nr:hypothetical protein [bacterium]